MISSLRGIRNNNPGNIRKGAPWQGLETEQPDPDFCTFKAPQWGIRAIAVTLITYQDKRRAHDGSKIDSIREVIERWAPATENNTQTYIAHVSRLTHIGAYDTVDVRKYEVMSPLVQAIITHENGAQPYDQRTIDEGLKSAGVEVPIKTLAESKTIRAGALAVPSAAVGLMDQFDGARDALTVLVPYWRYAAIAVAALTLISVGYMVWRRIKDNIQGAR